MVWMEIIIELRKFHNAQKKIRTNIFENWDSLSTQSFSLNSTKIISPQQFVFEHIRLELLILS